MPVLWTYLCLNFYYCKTKRRGSHPTNLRQVGTLGRPHRRGAEAKDNGRRNHGVRPRVELGQHVQRVTERAHHHGPLAGEFLDNQRRQEHTRHNERHVDGGQAFGTDTCKKHQRTLGQMHDGQKTHKSYKRDSILSG